MQQPRSENILKQSPSHGKDQGPAKDKRLKSITEFLSRKEMMGFQIPACSQRDTIQACSEMWALSRAWAHAAGGAQGPGEAVQRLLSIFLCSAEMLHRTTDWHYRATTGMRQHGLKHPCRSSFWKRAPHLPHYYVQREIAGLCFPSSASCSPADKPVAMQASAETPRSSKAQTENISAPK